MRPKKEPGSAKNPPTPWSSGFFSPEHVMFNVWLILQIMLIKWPWIVQPKKNGTTQDGSLLAVGMDKCLLEARQAWGHLETQALFCNLHKS